MPIVKSRNVYSDTTFFLVTIKDGKFNIKTFYNVGQKGKGIEFINETKNVKNEEYLLIGPHLDTGYSIEPTIITDIEEQRLKVLEHLEHRYTSFNPESVEL